mmetsp:Transcript_11146/g.18703  ORF Transcript_11146/g.18703 Transcript_11146/m.18703 type:complete len:97 (+) Transcript_11146:437-727(+)
MVYVPFDYPSSPPSAYFLQPVIHVNVSQTKLGKLGKNHYEVKFKAIQSPTEIGGAWTPQKRLFQFIVEVMEILRTPDDSKNYFPQSEESVELFHCY